MVWRTFLRIEGLPSPASRGESGMAMEHVDGDVRPEFAEDVEQRASRPSA